MKWCFFVLVGAVPLLGQQCTYTVSPTAINVTSNGGVNSINISTNSGACAWSFSTDSPAWINLSAVGAANNSVTGSGVLTVTVTASSLPTARTGSVSIQFGGGSQRIGVTEGAAPCSMTLNPASATLPASGGTSSFGVQTSCTWAATSNALWISVTPPAASGSSTSTGPPSVSGTGNGTVTYTAAANPCVASQSGTIIVTSQPNQTFTVTENGSPNNLTLSPASLNAPQAGTSGHLNVITGDSCSWSAFSDVGFIHINTTATGIGNGGLGYSIDANPGAPRNGNIHVGAQFFAVAQAGVTVPTMQLTTLNNAASYASGSIAPGEIVSLFGSNMGPSAGVGLQLSSDKQSITNSLSGVQVLFDGNAAPLIYASAKQINAVAPVGLAGKASTQVQVSYQGAMSNTITIPVAASAPGIFAADGSGVGGGAILNQDSSLNSRLNPAGRGSVVAIYLTGTGATNPASTDGAIAGNTLPLPSVAQTVAVMIGGVSVPASQIVYSGAAPGSVEGLTQIDAYVPQSVTPGPAVPVIVTIGGVASQPGITLSVN
jgi:trimeric autotransporter adhesin